MKMWMGAAVEAAIVVAIGLCGDAVLAQGFDSTLESELDQLELQGSSIPAQQKGSPSASATPSGKKSSTRNGGPMSAEELGLGLGPEDDVMTDLEPLADPFASDEPAPKAASSPKSQPTQQDVRTEPVVPKADPYVPTPKSTPLPVTSAPKTEPKLEPKPKAKPAPKAVAKKAKPKQVDESPLAPLGDEPNNVFESRLAEIYSASSDPVSDEKWTSLLGVKAAESYGVQSGDTLWDLSQTLFADGFYWSKLWAENPEIQNPHQIEKGQSIRFVGGDEASAPEVMVVTQAETKPEDDTLTRQAEIAFEKEDVVPAIQEPPPMEIDAPMPTYTVGMKPEVKSTVNSAPYYREDIEGKITQSEIDSGVVIEQSEIVPRPPLPPPSIVSRAPLRKMPNSFAEYRPQVYDSRVTIRRKKNTAERVPGAVVAGYIGVEEVPEPLATVVEVGTGDAFASLGQDVYLKSNEDLAVGSRLYTATPRYQMSSRRSGRLGTVLEVGGVLRVIEKVQGEDRLYRADVIFSVAPIRVDSLVLAGEPPRIQLTTKGRRNTREALIVGGGFDDMRRFFGDDAIVFLDAEDSEVKVGDVMAVQGRRGERRVSVAPDITKPIGILKVFAVSGKLASAFVVVATEEMRVGDRTGASFPRRLLDLKEVVPPIIKASAQ